MKQEITKKEFELRVKEEAKITKEDLKRQGTSWSLSECQREVRKCLLDEFTIKN